MAAVEDGDARCVEDSAVRCAAQWCPPLADGAALGSDGAVSHAHHIFRSYDVLRSARVLSVRGSRRIALQFPDSLLPHSFFVCAALEETLRLLLLARGGGEEGAEKTPLVFVLGDTSQGECCVDEVAAQHLDADIVMHYGNACLSPTRGLPVLYVFPRLRDDLDVAEGAGEVLRAQVQAVLAECWEAERVVVLYDVELHEYVQRAAATIVAGEETSGRPLIVARPRVDLCAVVEPRGDSDGAAVSDRSRERGECCGGAESGGCSAADGAAVVERPVSPTVATEELCARCSCGPLVFECACDRAGSALRMRNRTVFLWVRRKRSADSEDVYAAEGSSSIPLRNAALKYSASSASWCCGFYACEAHSPMVEAVNMSRLLGRRYALVDRVRSAERVGIVAGTLGVSGNLAVIERVKRVVEAADRRWYMLMVGKPNAPKLANFAEIDVFVLVACAQNALVDSRDHLRPVITPFEAEVAFGDRDWFSTAYSADFADVLASSAAHDSGSTGDAASYETAVARRGEWGMAFVGGAGAAAVVLKERAWQGLDMSHGMNGEDIAELPTRATEGRSGVAGGYDGEG